MNEKTLCPICGEGHVTDHLGQMETEYKGQKGLVASHYQLCDACGSDFAGAAEMRANKRTMQAFRKQVDGLLSGAEILALRKCYGLNQQQAAKLFGGGPVAFSKYENDDVAHSEAMDKLLRLVLRSESVFWELVAQEGMTKELKPTNAQRTNLFPTPLNADKVDFRLFDPKSYAVFSLREVLANKPKSGGEGVFQVLSANENVAVQNIASFAGAAVRYTLNMVSHKTGTPSRLGASEAVRNALAERQITQAEVSAAVDWARAKAPST